MSCDGGLWKSNYKPCDEFQWNLKILDESCRTFYWSLSCTGYVHGDLRDSNCVRAASILGRSKDRHIGMQAHRLWLGLDRKGDAIYLAWGILHDAVCRPENTWMESQITAHSDQSCGGWFLCKCRALVRIDFELHRSAFMWRSGLPSFRALFIVVVYYYLLSALYLYALVRLLSIQIGIYNSLFIIRRRKPLPYFEYAKWVSCWSSISEYPLGNGF